MTAPRAAAADASFRLTNWADGFTKGDTTMIVDVRTYTMVPGRLGAWLKLYEAEGMPIHVRHLGQPIGVFTTDVGTVHQVVFFWGFESHADRERRRDALEADFLPQEERGNRQRTASGV